ncbi:HAD-IA family hydrolase [Streptomyces californicus]|uniref:HAD-IA family hydrolase n=1 Tax=Streptomyces californicus TaxID=67351 RepID=UPI00371D1A77
MPRPEQPPRVLLIDMGGVFFTYSFLSALDAWARASGQDAGKLRERWRIDAPFDAFERGEITPAAYLDHLRHLLALDLSDHQLAAGWNAIYGHANTRLLGLLGTAEVRDRFHRVVGVSNTNTLHADFWRELYAEHLPVLETVHCSHEMGVTKPACEFFNRVAAAHGVRREHLVLIDDIPEVVDAARALGLAAHRYQDVDAFTAFLDTLPPATASKDTVL